MKNYILALILGVFASLGVVVATPQAAQAVSDANCIAAAQNAPNGGIAQSCRNEGWTINSYIAVGPNNNVRWWDRNVMRMCNSEYGGYAWPCWWNFDRGPAWGNDFWYDVGHNRHDVNQVTI